MKDSNNNIEAEFQEVSKSFVETRTGEPVRVFEGLSLSIEHNEFVGIVGRTGTGKTTLLNLLAGFIQPDHGIVRRRGQPVTRPGPEAMMVFQEFALFPWMTV
jgi:ABC-type nitrate/sulfonate/bicarbonate transport system ATPase subunit